MLRYVEISIPGGIAFADDPGAGYEYGEDLLVDFLSLRRANVARPGRGPSCDYAGFARRYGSLCEPPCAVSVPVGAQSLLADLGSAFPDGSARDLAVEREDLWDFHADCMRDIAMLHFASSHPRSRGQVTIARIVRDNCIVYDAADGSRKCLYHGSNGLRMPAAESAGADVPVDVARYLEAVNAGWTLSAPYDGEDEGLDAKSAWLAAHVGELLSGYVGAYLPRFRPARPCVLSTLMDRLSDLVESGKPLSFCILCGAPAPASFEGESQSFDRAACRAMFYRERESVKAAFVEGAGFTAEEADMLFDTRRRGYR